MNPIFHAMDVTWESSFRTEEGRRPYDKKETNLAARSFRPGREIPVEHGALYKNKEHSQLLRKKKFFHYLDSD